MSRGRISTKVGVLGVLLLAAGCGGGDDAETVRGQGRSTGDWRLCAAVAAERPMPDGAPTWTATVEKAAVPRDQQDDALAIIRRDPSIASALDDGDGHLAWATPWYVGDDAVRGALLFYEFDRPVSLPTDLGVPSNAGRGEGSGPPDLDQDGLPVLKPVEHSSEYEAALSAHFAVDLVDGRLHHIVAGSEPTLC